MMTVRVTARVPGYDQNLFRGTVIDTRVVDDGARNRTFHLVCWDVLDGRPIMSSDGAPIGATWLPAEALLEGPALTRARIA